MEVRMNSNQEEVQKVPKELRYNVTWDRNRVGTISDDTNIDTYLLNQLLLQKSHIISFSFSKINDAAIDRMTGGARYDERVHQLPKGPLIIYGQSYKWTIFRSGLRSLSLASLTFPIYYNQPPWQKEPVEYDE
jgi:hypothetical protein